MPPRINNRDAVQFTARKAAKSIHYSQVVKEERGQHYYIYSLIVSFQLASEKSYCTVGVYHVVLLNDIELLRWRVPHSEFGYIGTGVHAGGQTFSLFTPTIAHTCTHPHSPVFVQPSCDVDVNKPRVPSVLRIIAR